MRRRWRRIGEVAFKGEVIKGEQAARPATWAALGGHVLHYSMRRRELMNCISIVERDDWQVESWTVEGTKGELANDFRGWHRMFTLRSIAAVDHVIDVSRVNAQHVERAGGDVDRRGTLTAATELSTLVTGLSLAPGSVIVDILRKISAKRSKSEKCADRYRLLAQNYDILATVEEEFVARWVFRSENRISLQFQAELPTLDTDKTSASQFAVMSK